MLYLLALLALLTDSSALCAGAAPDALPRSLLSFALLACVRTVLLYLLTAFAWLHTLLLYLQQRYLTLRLKSRCFAAEEGRDCKGAKKKE